MLLGAGSYLFRYAVGTEFFQPPKPMSAIELVRKAAQLGFELVQFADNLPLENLSSLELEELRVTATQHQKLFNQK